MSPCPIEETPALLTVPMDELNQNNDVLFPNIMTTILPQRHWKNNRLDREKMAWF